MTTRKKFLLLAGAALLGGLLCWRGVETVSTSPTQPAAITREMHRDLKAIAAADPFPRVAPESAPATRRAAAELVKALYRKEQLTRELDLEQQRYGRHYWQSEGSGRGLAQLRQAKEALLRQLSAEANQILNDLFPDEAGEPITLPALFDSAHAGPNLTFLSPSSRERFESEILADDSDRGVERERLLELATRVLPPGEMESYRQWNDRPAAALREQLVGFNPTESEFTAILRETSLAADDGDTRGTDAELEAQLGTARYGVFLKLQDPAMHTALHDLQRLGLPLDAAEWLVATRTHAIAEMGETWQGAALTDAMKRERVAQLERAYGQVIAAQLALPEASLDGINPSS